MLDTKSVAPVIVTNMGERMSLRVEICTLITMMLDWMYWLIANYPIDLNLRLAVDTVDRAYRKAFENGTFKV